MALRTRDFHWRDREKIYFLQAPTCTSITSLTCENQETEKVVHDWQEATKIGHELGVSFTTCGGVVVSCSSIISVTIIYGVMVPSLYL